MKVIANRNILKKFNLISRNNLLSVIVRHFGAKEKLVNNSSRSVSESEKTEKIREEISEDEARRVTEEREGFRKMTEFLLKREEYTWEDYKQQVIYTNQTDRSVWKRFRLRQDEEKQEVNDTNKFVSALLPDEFTKEDFSEKDIKDITKIAEIHDGFIVLMINNYRYHKGLHSFIREKHAKNESLPKTPEELFDLANSEHPPEFIINFQRKMYTEIKKKLGYTDEYIQRKDQEMNFEKMKKMKKTYQF